MIDVVDTLNESFSSVADLQSLIKNRVASVGFNLVELLKSSGGAQHIAEILTHVSLLLCSSLTDRPSHLESYLHELGVLSVVCSPTPSSTSTSATDASGMIGRVWQLAARMKRLNTKSTVI